MSGEVNRNNVPSILVLIFILGRWGGWRHINDEMFKGIGIMFPRLGNMCINPTRRQQELPGTHPKSNLLGFSAKGTLNSTTDNT